MSTVSVVGVPIQVVAIFARTANRCEVWGYSDGRIHSPDWTIPDALW